MIYTAGYIGHPSNALRQLAINLEATIVDIRVSPRSANPQYNRAALQALLGKRYVHLIEWGNVNYKGEGPIKIADFDKGLRKFKKISGNTILLCACKNFHSCHRKVIADRLGDVQEVTPDQWKNATLDTQREGNYALSIRQPWAWLVVNGYKDLENRDWYSPFRGEFWIHTGKRFDMHGWEWVCNHFPGIQMPRLKTYPLGGLVGMARIVDCVDWWDSPWFVGDHAFLIEDATSIPFVPLAGAQGFFKFTMPIIGESADPLQESLFKI